MQERLAPQPLPRDREVAGVPLLHVGLPAYYLAAQPQSAHWQQVHGAHLQDVPHLQHEQAAAAASGLVWVDALSLT